MRSEALSSTASNALFSHGDFRPVKPRKTRRQPPKASDVANEDSESGDDECSKMSEGDTRSKSTKLFTCPNEGCIRVYKRYGSMVNHVSSGKCEFQLERESLLDTAKAMYSKKLWGGELSLKIDNTDGSAPIRKFPYPIYTRKRKKVGHCLQQRKQNLSARNRENSWKKRS